MQRPDFLVFLCISLILVFVLHGSLTPETPISAEPGFSGEDSLRGISYQALEGRYQRIPVENGFHDGTITYLEKSGSTEVLQWKNKSGVSWKLFLYPNSDSLNTGKDNPYYDSYPETGRAFIPRLQRIRGQPLPVVTGFYFLNEFYRKVDSNPGNGPEIEDPARARLEYLVKYGMSRSYSKELFGQKEFADQHFSTLQYEAVDVYLHAVDAYKRNDISRAGSLLDQLWKDYPPGTEIWHQGFAPQKTVNIGSPAAYYALRMLTEIVLWRLSGGKIADDARTAYLTVLLPGESKGIQPRNMRELKSNTGILSSNRMHLALKGENYKAIHDMSWLYLEYMAFVSDGLLRPVVRVVDMDGFSVSVFVRASQYGGSHYYHAGLTPQASNELLAAVNHEIRYTTDWWWLIHPSHIPEKYDELKDIPFITGGMGRAPGGAPLFISDDMSHVTMRRFQGGRQLTALERKVYTPEWFQHEIFHFFFAEYAKFGLEKKGHDWFQRSSWPADFHGIYEADYFQQAFEKRLRRAHPPIITKITYAGPDRSLLRKLAPSDLAGRYKRLPVENDFHEVNISHEGGNKYRWTIRSGSSWGLEWNPEEGLFLTDKDNPYYKTWRHVQADLFRNDRGGYDPAIRAVIFNGEPYIKE